MLQVIRAIMKDPDDHTVCHLLFANQVSGHSRDVQTQLLLRGATGPGEACLGVRVGGAPNILSTGSFAAAGGGWAFQPQAQWPDTWGWRGARHLEHPPPEPRCPWLLPPNRRAPSTNRAQNPPVKWAHAGLGGLFHR